MNRVYTDFLVSDDSFFTGAAAIFNIDGNFYRYNRSATPQAADARAIRQDFAVIGQDIMDVAQSAQRSKDAQLPLGL
jgi:hypothetical protein